MSRVVQHLRPPYFAVVFTNVRNSGTVGETGDDGYEAMAGRMVELAARQPGFLGIESVRDAAGVGITVSYWESEEAILGWRRNGEHLEAQRKGRERWYQSFRLRVCRVEREYGMGEAAGGPGR